MTGEIPSGEYKQRCGECSNFTSIVSNYCPKCGAELRDDDKQLDTEQ